MLRRSRGKPIRIASKSVRSRPVLERLLDLDRGFQGLLDLHAPRDALALGAGHARPRGRLPDGRPACLTRLARITAEDPDEAPVVMVDCVEHLDLIEEAAASFVAPIRVAIDIDLSWWPLGRPAQDRPEALADPEPPSRPSALARRSSGASAHEAGRPDGLRGPDRRRRRQRPRQVDQQRPGAGDAVALLAKDVRERRGRDRQRALRGRRARVRERRRHRLDRADRRRVGRHRDRRGLRLLRAAPLRPLPLLPAQPGGDVRAAGRAASPPPRRDRARRRLSRLRRRAARTGCPSPTCPPG